MTPVGTAIRVATAYARVLAASAAIDAAARDDARTPRAAPAGFGLAFGSDARSRGVRVGGRVAAGLARLLPAPDPGGTGVSGGNLICGYASPPPSSAQIPLNSVNP